MTDSLLVPFLNWFHSNSPFSNFLSLLVFVCLKIWWWLVSAHNGFLFLCFYYNSPEVAFLTLLTHRPFICSTCGHHPPQQSSPVEQSFFHQSRVFSAEQSSLQSRVGHWAEVLSSCPPNLPQSLYHENKLCINLHIVLSQLKTKQLLNNLQLLIYHRFEYRKLQIACD